MRPDQTQERGLWAGARVGRSHTHLNLPTSHRDTYAHACMTHTACMTHATQTHTTQACMQYDTSTHTHTPGHTCTQLRHTSPTRTCGTCVHTTQDIQSSLRVRGFQNPPQTLTSAGAHVLCRKQCSICLKPRHILLDAVNHLQAPL